MRYNKKGALELSITAIVILIIAITILGLGIGFIKKQFGAGTELVGGKLTEIKEQMKEDIRHSGELLVLSMPETELSIGKPQDVLIGVKNTLSNPNAPPDKVCYWIEVRCLNAFSRGNFCTPDGQNDVVVGGVDIANNDYPQNNWFSSLLSQFDIRKYDAEVYPATMLVRDAQPDRYVLEMNLYRDASSGSCSQIGEFPSDAQLYASKTFTINVK
ncbi:hypothetical protein DRJ25_02230 [Candidatus Woesearchaeota archaeon]|nr:MAG: hypothetical protein DRJ25_02230 [Candidatus Woesearchaeota archaeon]